MNSQSASVKGETRCRVARRSSRRRPSTSESCSSSEPNTQVTANQSKPRRMREEVEPTRERHQATRNKCERNEAEKRTARNEPTRKPSRAQRPREQSRARQQPKGTRARGLPDDLPRRPVSPKGETQRSVKRRSSRRRPSTSSCSSSESEKPVTAHQSKPRRYSEEVEPLSERPQEHKNKFERKEAVKKTSHNKLQRKQSRAQQLPEQSRADQLPKESRAQQLPKGETEWSIVSIPSRRRPTPSDSCTSSGSNEQVPADQSVSPRIKQEVEPLSEKYQALKNLCERNETARVSGHKKLPRKPVATKVPHFAVRSTEQQATVLSQVPQQPVRSTWQQLLEPSEPQQLPESSSQRQQLPESSSQRQQLAMRCKTPQLPEGGQAQELPKGGRAQQLRDVLPRRPVKPSCKPRTMFVEVLLMDTVHHQLMKDIAGIPCGRENDMSSDDEEDSLGPRMMWVAEVDGQHLQLPTFGRVVYPAGMVRAAHPMGRDSREAALQPPHTETRTTSRPAGQALPQCVGGQRLRARCQPELPAGRPFAAPKTQQQTDNTPQPTTDSKPIPKVAGNVVKGARVIRRPQTRKLEHGRQNHFLMVVAPTRHVNDEPQLPRVDTTLQTWTRQSMSMQKGVIDKTNYRRCQFCGRDFINTSLSYHENICKTHVPVKAVRKWNRMHFKPKT